MKRALLSKPIHPVEDYEQDMLAELARQLARFDKPKPDKGHAATFGVVLLGVLMGLVGGAVIIWAVVV